MALASSRMISARRNRAVRRSCARHHASHTCLNAWSTCRKQSIACLHLMYPSRRSAYFLTSQERLDAGTSSHGSDSTGADSSGRMTDLKTASDVHSHRSKHLGYIRHHRDDRGCCAARDHLIDFLSSLGKFTHTWPTNQRGSFRTNHALGGQND